MFRPVNRLKRRAGGSVVPGQSLASIVNQRLASGHAKLPKAGVGDAANVLFEVFCRPQPAVLATGFRPKRIGRGRVPGWHVDSVRHMSDRHLLLRPVRKERLEEMPANFSMQATHAIYRPAAVDRQIGHIETLRRVVRILAAQGQQIVNCNAKLFLGVPTEVLFNKGRSESIKAGGHCGVGGKKVTRSCDG